MESAGPIQQVELYIFGRNLANKDTFSKSDPRATLYVKENSNWKLIGHTETIQNNLNPAFAKTFILQYRFESHQYLKFEVTDIDDGNSGDLIGVCEVELGQIAGAKNQLKIMDLQGQNGKTTGKLVVKLENAGQVYATPTAGKKTKKVKQPGPTVADIIMRWKGVNLQKPKGCMCFGAGMDAFLRFSKKADGDIWLKVHETNHIKENFHPLWMSHTDTLQHFCSENKSTPMKVEYYNWNDNGEHKYMGEAVFTVAELEADKRKLGLMDSQTQINVGHVELQDFEIRLRVTEIEVEVIVEEPVPQPNIHLMANQTCFLDYLRGGWQLNFVGAVDFTGSNGEQTRSDSLHAVKTNGTLNQYQTALKEICSIVLNYDYDQNIPLYGFGASMSQCKLPGGTLSCFPLSGDPEQLEVHGLGGIMECYAKALPRLRFSGPTNFAPVISSAMTTANASLNKNPGVYTILLIMTDGAISDFAETKKKIQEATKLPLSIIIVGVGSTDFSSMVELDGDNPSTKIGDRDIVQFVAFRDYESNIEKLKEDVLAEVPTQLVEYMKKNNIKPNPPAAFDINALVPTTQQMFAQNPMLINTGQQLLGGYIPVIQQMPYAPQNGQQITFGNAI
jgi:hypothetical protein